jgi:hypothetical protein
MKKIALFHAIEGFVFFGGVSLAASQPAHAYLDPGSGSYALQVAIAGLFGFLFSAKMFWGRMKENLFPTRVGSSMTAVESTKDTSSAPVNE